MLQWFNKQTDSSSLDREGNSEQSLSSSPSALSDDDYEFLFNQLLDGVSHGWHLGKIINFFNNLEHRSDLAGWVAWFERFESRVVYANDPARRRVGAIMMRLGELTQSNEELKQFGSISQRIGKKLFIGDVSQLIWEYDGKDFVKAEEIDVQSASEPEVAIEPATEEIINPVLASSQDTDTAIASEKSIEESSSQTFTKSFPESEPIKTSESAALEEQTASSEESTSESDDALDRAIDSLAELTEQLTVLQDENADSEPETADPALASSQNTLIDPPQNLTQAHLETSLESAPEEANDPEPALASSQNTLIDPVSEPETRAETPREPFPESVSLDKQASKTESSSDNVDNAIDSLAELTEQLTVLQDATPDSETEPELEATFTTEQPTVSPDLVPEPETPPEVIANPNSVDSLAELTEQLTVLQEELDPESDPDLEHTLLAPEQTPSSSVESFLEATKALVPEAQKEPATPLTWDEFVMALEQDPKLAEQVAQHLKLESSDPREILKAAVERFKKRTAPPLDIATMELVESWFQLGLKQASAEDFQGAIASWDKALNLNPDLSEAWHNRGSALGRLEKYEAAIQSFNKAIKIAPNRYQAWNDRAHALYQIQQWQQAVDSWDKAIAIMPDNYQFWYNRACALEQLQRFDESVSSYEKALEIKPDFQPARSRYISLIKENSSSSIN